ncbi:hypothetical protein [Paraburkholderia tropica]|uniref:hypothetical protein n=1 Tax=Paraburkholderia tropica TaxID=92647 RepID=UPI002AB0813E|nr:hypothetical protein [Paraburkholderia tropica]
MSIQNQLAAALDNRDRQLNLKAYGHVDGPVHITEHKENPESIIRLADGRRVAADRNGRAYVDASGRMSTYGNMDEGFATPEQEAAFRETMRSGNPGQQRSFFNATEANSGADQQAAARAELEARGYAQAFGPASGIATSTTRATVDNYQPYVDPTQQVIITPIRHPMSGS